MRQDRQPMLSLLSAVSPLLIAAFLFDEEAPNHVTRNSRQFERDDRGTKTLEGLILQYVSWSG